MKIKDLISVKLYSILIVIFFFTVEPVYGENTYRNKEAAKRVPITRGATGQRSKRASHVQKLNVPKRTKGWIFGRSFDSSNISEQLSD